MSKPTTNYGLQALGAGIGLRREHFDDIIKTNPPVRWFEVIPENFINRGGYVADCLRKISEKYKLVAHSISVSIGSTDPFDMDHLKRLRAFCDTYDSPWFSDHLCFTMVDHVNLNDLIPLPFTRDAINNVVERVKIVQDVMERPFLLENVTYYMAVSKSRMTEAEFITSILEEANCGLLLDVSNVVLNAKMHEYDPIEFLDSIPLERVGQLHLAGFEEKGDVLLDTHGKPVSDETWDLFRAVIERIGPSSPLVEWDVAIPTLERLMREADMAQTLMDEVCASRAS